MDRQPGMGASLAQADATEKVNQQKVRNPKPIVVNPAHPGNRRQAAPEQKALTPMRTMEAVRSFQVEQHRWPTTGELVAMLTTGVDLSKYAIEDKIRNCRNRGWLDYGEPLTPTEIAPFASEVTVTNWTPEQIAERMALLKPPSTSPFKQVAKPAAPAPPTIPVNPISKKEVQQEMPTGHPIAWPDDKILVDKAQTLHDAHLPVANVLCAKYGCKSVSRFWKHLGAARERLGMPRNMEPHRPAKETNKADPSAPPVCDLCYDTGIKHADESGEPCTCVVGQRIRESLFGDSESAGQPETPLTAPAVTEPAATAAPAQGVGSPEQTDASASPTIANQGILTDLPPDKAFGAKPEEITGSISSGVRIPPSPVESDTRVAELQQLVKDLEAQLAHKESVLTEFRTAVGVQAGKIDELTRALEGAQELIAAQAGLMVKAANEAQVPALLLIEGVRIRALPMPERPLPVVGDHWAEPVHIADMVRFNIWACIAAGEIGGMRPVRLMRLVADMNTIGEVA